MCGIAGFVHFDRLRPASEIVIRRMANTLMHRGPDGDGFFVFGNVALGHRRLAIIDLETGNQPLANEDGTVAVVFNGEIYNYLELRAELAALGHQFRTSTDTEVLVHGYEEWGLGLESKLNGMWAFALWDGKASRLVLSRDRLGEKPLYYAAIDGTLVFGSEPKAILAYDDSHSPDLSVLELYLSLGFLPCPLTFWKDIRKISPGWHLVLHGGAISMSCYWDLPAIPETSMNRNSQDVSERFEYLLRDSVRLRMRSDVDFGAFLSGGLDSATVVSLMAELSSRPVKTFTIGFNQSELDERPLARAVAAKFGTQHHEELVEYPEFEESIAKILNHTDEPFGDSSSLPTERVSGYASRSVRMVLSGDGGDEVQSGYNAYQSERLVGYLSWAPAPAVCGAAGLMRLASRSLSAGMRERAAHAAKVIALTKVPFQTRLLEKSWAKLATVRALLSDVAVPQVPVDDFLADFFRSCPWRDPFYQLMYYNLKLTLPEDMLTKVDRMSMANSLEVRAPFLDHRLVEWMASAHKNVKLPGFERKAVLRRSLARNLPRCVASAGKRGFVAPVRYWFGEDRGSRVVASVLRDCPLPLRRDVVTQVLEANARRDTNYGNFIWMVLVLAQWMKPKHACAS